jgi:hypothetical protein
MVSNDFQKGLEERLIEFKEKHQFLPSKNKYKLWQYFDISDNLFPPIKHSFLQFAYDESIPFHEFINHVRSSQVFGFNLFYPLLYDTSDGHKSLLKLLEKIYNGNLLRILNYTFEYSPDKDLLGEWTGNNKPGKYLTAVDVLLTCENEKMEKIVFLIEIKFTEEEFGECNGYISPGCSASDKENCNNFINVIKNNKLCYLHQKYKQRSARKYFEYFDMENEFRYNGNVCPFKNNNQCLRNHALARAMLKERICKKSFFGLVYYDYNHNIEKSWEEYKNLTNNSNELFCIKASDIIKQYNNETYKLYFEKRYGLK